MVEDVTEIDDVSDELVGIFTNRNMNRTDRDKAAESLFRRHKSWVAREISKRVSNPSDVEDIAQMVWMWVLDPKLLKEKYRHRNGRFRGFLLNPIKWSVGNHFESLRASSRSEPQVTRVQFKEIDESTMEKRMETVLYEDVIEGIIKPYLKRVPVKPRTAFVINEYGAMFEDEPSVSELSLINGLAEESVMDILKRTKNKKPDEISDEEMPVYLPSKYNSLVSREELYRNSTRQLASIMCLSESAFRKNLHKARTAVIEFVREKIDSMDIGSTDHG